MNRRRIYLLLACAALVLCFRLAYVIFVSPAYSYYGLTYEEASFERQLLVWVLSLAPALWLPTRLTRPSQAIYLVLYATVYIPAVFVAMVSGQLNAYDGIVLSVILLLGMAIMGSSYLVVPLRVAGAEMPVALANWSLIALAVVGNIWIIATYRGIMRIPDLAEIYELRFAAAAATQGNLVHYAQMMMPGAVNPLLMAYGLARRSWVWILTGLAGNLVVFMATGLKSVVLFPLFAIGLWTLLQRPDRLPGRLIWGLAGALGIIAALQVTIGIDNSSPALFAGASVVASRAFSIRGLLISLYFIYFQTHPLTYFTHINVIARMAGYSKTDLVHVDIGKEFWGSDDLSANASFWAQDGLAGLGLPGVLVVSLLVAILFWLIDSMCARHDLRVATVALLFQGITLSDTSLFTTLLSGGMGLSLFLLWIMPRQQVFRPASKGIKVALRRREYPGRVEEPALAPFRPS